MKNAHCKWIFIAKIEYIFQTFIGELTLSSHWPKLRIKRFQMNGRFHEFFYRRWK